MTRERYVIIIQLKCAVIIIMYDHYRELMLYGIGFNLRYLYCNIVLSQYNLRWVFGFTSPPAFVC